MPDDTDRRLLRYMQADPMLSTSELAGLAGVSSTVAWRRLDRLAQNGVLAGVEAVIDWTALGYGVEVSLRITIDKTRANAFDELILRAREVPEVTEIQTFLGRVDLRLNILARDMAHYTQLYRDRILTLPHIQDIEQLMLISTVKNDPALPL